MKYLSSTPWLLSVLVLLCGCGGYSGSPYTPPYTPPSTPPSGPPSSPPPQAMRNWQFSTTSVAGMPPATIAGAISQSGSSVSGAVHVDGSKCFDRLTTVGLTGTLTGGDISLTSTSVGGQVVILTGSITDYGNAFTGTYTINGGCANGDHGSVTGREVAVIRGSLGGTFTTSGGGTFDIGGYIYAGPASSEGSFSITGTATFGTSCFGSGELVAGTYPSGSYMIGTSVVLTIQTDNGTLIFVGTDTEPGIRGEYTVTGGTCDQTGTALLVDDPWGY